MNNCAKLCKRDNIGQWYTEVSRNLSTLHFDVTKITHDKLRKNKKQKNDIFDF